jgi:hypothetical protein
MIENRTGAHLENPVSHSGVIGQNTRYCNNIVTMGRPKESKVFFFEKKKQKTFMSFGAPWS